MPLSEHINVWESCLQLLERKGYALSALLEDEDRVTWRAERDGFVFFADSPISLLGLVAMRDELAPSSPEGEWWHAGKDRSRELRDTLIREAEEREEAAVERCSDPEWSAEVRAVWEESEEDVVLVAGILDLRTDTVKRVLARLGLRAPE